MDYEPAAYVRYPEDEDTISFAIIGVHKSATTTIQHLLAQHPGVFIPYGEIACFESPDYEQGRPLRQLAFLKDKGGRNAGIKRPNIFPDFRAVHRLKRHSPSCKAIIILRDPVERFVSAYFHTMNSSKIPVIEINRAVRAMFEGNYLSKYPAAMMLLHYGLYYDSLRNILDSFGEESVFVTTHERVNKDRRALMHEICEFLNIEFIDINEQDSSKNIGSYDYRRARFLRIANFFKYRYSTGRLRKEVSNSFLCRTIGGAISRISAYRPFSSPISFVNTLDDDVAKRLNDYYASDRKLLLKDFSQYVYW